MAAAKSKKKSTAKKTATKVATKKRASSPARRDPTAVPKAPKARRKHLVARARDKKNEARGQAVELLSIEVRTATDRLERRYALYALGQTKHPNATPALVEALDDPNVGDSVPLICTALAECGDTRAIRILEQRVDGPHGGFVLNAIESIKARVEQIHKEVLQAALHDEDPVIADLARRAKDGEEEAAIVLEDALLEQGRL